MLNIYLVRHGQDADNAHSILNGRRDPPLTTRGINQAGELAQKIKHAGLHFTAIYTSPLKRARQTAQIIAKVLGGPKPVKLTDLIERDFGIMAGKSHTQIGASFKPDVVATKKLINELKN